MPANKVIFKGTGSSNKMICIGSGFPAAFSAWKYRKTLTISHASGALTNYQVKILIGETSGASGEDVDVNGHANGDLSDLRFTNSAGTLLDHWIDVGSQSGTTPNRLYTVWVECDSIGTGDTTFYMYYGNASASDVSSGANTFIVFDNFERGSNGQSLDQAIVGGSWTVVQGAVTISTDVAYSTSRCAKFTSPTADQPIATIPVTSSANIAIRVRYYKKDTAQMTFAQGDGSGSYTASMIFETDEDVGVYDGSSYVDSTLNCKKVSWGYWEMYAFDWTNGTMSIDIDGVTKTGRDITWTYGGIDNILYVTGTTSVGNESYLDDLLVRNYNATAPSVSYGAETSGGSNKLILQS